MIRQITNQTHSRMFSFKKTPTNFDRNSLSHINIPQLSEYKAKICEEDLSEGDLINSPKSMKNDKFPGSNGLTKEFYETFWNEHFKLSNFF